MGCIGLLTLACFLVDTPIIGNTETKRSAIFKKDSRSDFKPALSRASESNSLNIRRDIRRGWRDKLTRKSPGRPSCCGSIWHTA